MPIERLAVILVFVILAAGLTVWLAVHLADGPRALALFLPAFAVLALVVRRLGARRR